MLSILHKLGPLELNYLTQLNELSIYQLTLILRLYKPATLREFFKIFYHYISAVANVLKSLLLVTLKNNFPLASVTMALRNRKALPRHKVFRIFGFPFPNEAK